MAKTNGKKRKRERTTGDKLKGASITVDLGGKEYEIRPLPIRPADAWLKQYQEYMQRMAKTQSINTAGASQDEIIEGMSYMLCGSQSKMTDLFFDYAVDLKPLRKEIENSATHLDIFAAMQEVLLLANPTLAAAQMLKVVAAAPGREKTTTSKP